jgi:hypothetical protein
MVSGDVLLYHGEALTMDDRDERLIDSPQMHRGL